MENQYSIRIGNTNFIVSVKQSETAKKPMDTAFRGLCVHEVLGDCFASDKFNLEEIKKLKVCQTYVTPSCKKLNKVSLGESHFNGRIGKLLYFRL